MKVAVIGANGQLGNDLCRELDNFNLIPLTQDDIEISNMSSVKEVFSRCQPEIIINTAAYVRVDDCETNQDKAFLVNALGARNIAVIARELDTKLIHISTDYVFGGEAKQRTIPYTEFDTPYPINVYGKSKLAGENFIQFFCPKHFIVRTSGLFGIAGSEGKGGNFVETIFRLAKQQEELKIVNDQVFSPTYTKDLAKKIVQLITTEYYGIYHITNKGACSWYEFTKAILNLARLKTQVIAITSDQYPTPAKRPRFSVLDNYQLRLLGMDDMRTWQEALRDYIAERAYFKKGE